MTELIEFLTSKEIIMVYIVAIMACALYFVIHLIDKHYYKRKQKHNTRELNRLVENINYELSKEREEIATIPEDISQQVIHVEPVLEELTLEEPTIIQSEILEDKTLELNNEKIVVEVNETGNNKIESQESVGNNSKEELDTTLEEQPEIIETNRNEEILDTIEPEEILDYTSAEPNQTEAQDELRRLTEELTKAEQEAPKNINLTSYEEMQEKEAIISLEELLKRSKEMYESNELTQYADEGNEPISLEDLEKKVKESLEVEELSQIVTEPTAAIPTIAPLQVEEMPEETNAYSEPNKFVMEDFYTIKANETRNSQTAYQQYKSMPIISPIYGLEKESTKTDLELENTANYEKLDEEIKKTNEFIMTLKELQKNLD